MTGPYATAVIVVGLVLAVWALVLVVADRRPDLPLLVGAALLELLLVGLLVGGVVQMVGSSRSFARLEFVGYLVSCVLVLPVAVVWGLGERSRAGTGVLVVGFLVVPVLVVRVQQVWAGPGG